MVSRAEALQNLAVTTFATGGRSLGLEAGVVGLLEDHVLDEGLDDDELLNDLSFFVRGLADDDTLALGLEEHATGGDVLRTAVLLLDNTDAGESHLEDADAIETYFLTEFEEVLHGTAELVEDGLDVGLLHRSLGLDELGQFLGGDEMLVVDSRGEPLTVGGRVVVGVLEFFEFLGHNFEKLKKLKKLKKLVKLEEVKEVKEVKEVSEVRRS